MQKTALVEAEADGPTVLEKPDDRPSTPVTTTLITAAADEDDEPELVPLPPWRRTLVIFSLWIGTLLVAIDTTIITVAVPHIATEFKAFDHVGWYGSAYLFTVTAFQPAVGNIFQLFDAKWTYLASVMVFEGVFFTFFFEVVCSGGGALPYLPFLSNKTREFPR